MELPTPGAAAPDDAPAEALAVAPPVVVVVVARDPGAWFEEVMASIAHQDYPNLSTLVIDAGSAEDVRPRVAVACPNAFVRRLDADPGFGAAANEVLEAVEGAAFYLICHDDVALAPDGLRLLVEEAFRSNAAVVGPKLVRWDDPRRLLQLGQGMDHAGYGIPLVERGELDQSQHDAVRDVFTVPGPCTLVRADLFAEVGGFDEGIRDFLDDVSLCWRAHIAGARVIVAPAAVARHRDELAKRHGYDERRRIQARHRLRLVLSCYGRLGALRAIVLTAVLNVVEVVYALLAGRPRRAGDIGSAWWWNLKRIRDLRMARAQVRGFRRLPDREVRRAMARGSARMHQFLRGQIGRGDDRFSGLARSSRAAAGDLSGGSRRAAATTWAVVAVVLLAGSRHLITRGVPAVGELVAFSQSPVDLFRAWFSGWRTAGLGAEVAAPTAFGSIGGLGVAFFGAMGLLRLVLTVGMIPLGALFAYRLPAPVGSRWAQIVCLIVYVTVPLPYNALAAGRWGSLVLYAAAPALLGGLARASGVPPFGSLGGGRMALRRGVLGVGLTTALLATILPVAVVIVPVIAVALALGGLVAVTPRGGLRLVVVGVGAALVAVVLHVPWSIGTVGSDGWWTALTGVPSTSTDWALADLLRFEVGPLGSAPVGWCFLVAAALPLLIGRAERHAWAVRAWTLSVVFFGLAWAAEQGDLPISMPPVDVLLVPAAVGLALATGLGVAAFEVDLPGYRFGWRQVASAAAAAAVVVGILPVLGASIDGRWSMPAGDHDRALAFIDAENEELPFRVLWLGDPAVLPLEGWELEESLAYATTDDGAPDLENLWVGPEEDPTDLLREAVDLALGGETARLGRLLSPMGIRYVVVPERLAPAPFSDDEVPAPESLTTTLSAQLDLVPLDVPAGLTVYRNEAFMPTRAVVPADTPIPDEGGLSASLGLDLSTAAPALPDEDGRLRWSGPLEPETTLLHSAAASERWDLEVEGGDAERVEPFGWANGFSISGGGDATLSFSTPALRYGLLALQVLLWLGAIRVLLRVRLGPGPLDDGADA